MNNRPDILDSLNRRRKEDGETELQKVALSELRRSAESTESTSERESSPKARSWDSDSESEGVRSLLRRSGAQLDAAEGMMSAQSPDLLRSVDYVRHLDPDCSRPCLRARLCLAVTAFSILVIVYIHIQ